MFVNIRNIQILILSHKTHSLEISYLQKNKNLNLKCQPIEQLRKR